MGFICVLCVCMCMVHVSVVCLESDCQLASPSDLPASVSSAEAARMCSHAQLFTWVPGLQTRVLLLA